LVGVDGEADDPAAAAEDDNDGVDVDLRLTLGKRKSSMAFTVASGSIMTVFAE